MERRFQSQYKHTEQRRGRGCGCEYAAGTRISQIAEPSTTAAVAAAAAAVAAGPFRLVCAFKMTHRRAAHRTRQLTSLGKQIVRK